MRYKSLAFCFGLAVAIAATDLFGAGTAAVGHGTGVPSTGTQNGFGRTGSTPPNYNSTTAPATGTSSPTPTGSQTISGPTNTGPSVNTGSTPGLGSVNDQNNPYPMTTPEGAGVVPGPNAAPGNAAAQAGANNATTSGASGAASAASTAPNVAAQAGNTAVRRQIRYFQGHWWYPMVGGNWVYWDNVNSSWVFFPATNTALANNTAPSGRHASGYRGLDGANQAEIASPPSQPTTGAWFWHNGEWLWFNGRTFVK
jgi:hypothetical protein